MNKILSLFIVTFLVGVELLSQNTLSGNFSALGNQSIRLVGFDGFEIYTIDSVRASANGAFSLSYSEKDYGMGYLATNDNKSFILVLGNETMHLTRENFGAPESIRVKGSN